MENNIYNNICISYKLRATIIVFELMFITKDTYFRSVLEVRQNKKVLRLYLGFTTKYLFIPSWTLGNVIQ
jgi:hypothetical protein